MLPALLFSLLGQAPAAPEIDLRTIWVMDRACYPAQIDDPNDDGLTYFSATVYNHSGRSLSRLKFVCRLQHSDGDKREVLYEEPVEATTENSYAVDPKTCFTVKTPGMPPLGRLNVVFKLKIPPEALKTYDGYWMELTGVEAAPVPAAPKDVFEAARQGNEEALASLLKADPRAVTKTDAAGSTPLHAACLYQASSCVEALLAAGANPAAKNQYDIQPLHYAAASWGRGQKRARVVEALLRAGADVNAVSKTVGTPIAIAALHDDEAAVRVLLQKRADPNLRTAWSGAVVQAARAAHREVMEALLTGGGDPNMVNSLGRPALVTAAMSDYGPVELLLWAGAKPNAVDPDTGRTALHEAADGGKVGTVEALLKAGADRALKDKKGATALDLARAKGYGPIVAVLERS